MIAPLSLRNDFQLGGIPGDPSWHICSSKISAIWKEPYLVLHYNLFGIDMNLQNTIFIQMLLLLLQQIHLVITYYLGFSIYIFPFSYIKDHDFIYSKPHS